MADTPFFRYLSADGLIHFKKKCDETYQPKEAGKGLSQENFTTELKDLLLSLKPGSGSLPGEDSGYVKKVGDVMTGPLTVTELTISGNSGRPGTTNATTLGESSYRWSNVYSVLGNFSGAITATGGIVLPYAQLAWTQMADYQGCIRARTGNSANGAHALISLKNNNGNTIIFGGYQGRIGFFGFRVDDVIDNNDNPHSFQTYWGDSGNLYHDTDLIVNGQIIANAKKVAPFVVASNVLVDNLNADLLDGYHASDFLVGVSLSSPKSGQVLQYDGSKWVNADAPMGGLSEVSWNDIKSRPTTLSGYGITDVKISGGTITIGNNSITPVTSSDLSGYLTSKDLNGYLTSSDLSGYLKTSGGTVSGTLTFNSSGRIVLPWTNYSWSNAINATDCIRPTKANSSSSVHALIITESMSGNRLMYGGYQDRLGFFGFTADAIASGSNSTSFQTYWKTDSGDIYHNKSLTVVGILKTSTVQISDTPIQLIASSTTGIKWVVEGSTDAIILINKSLEIKPGSANTNKVSLGSSDSFFKNVYSAEFSNTSDARLKEVINPELYIGLDDIADAPAVEFIWKSTGNKSYGTLAQYWKSVNPILVTEGKKLEEDPTGDGILSLNNNLAIIGMISLGREIKALKAELSKLRSSIS